MKRAVFAVCGIALAAVLCGCASQQIVQREFYELNEATMREREENAPAPEASGCLSAKREPRRGCKGPRLKVGALKSETVKTGQPDWSTKSISIISVGK